MGMSKTSLARVISSCTWGLPDQVRSILNKYESTLLIPGVSGVLRFGYQPGNYRESTGQTLAAADQQVGLVVDAARPLGPELLPTLNFNSWLPINGATAVSDTSFNTTIDGGMRLPGLLTPGKMYAVTVTFTISSGTLSLFADSSKSELASGVTVRIVSDGTGFLYLRNSGAANTVVSGISVRELPGIHASQATSGYQPYLRKSGGVNSWQFDGVDDRMVLSEILSGASDYCDLHAVTLQPKVGASTFADFRNNAGTGTHVGRLRMSNTGVLLVSHMNDAGTVFGANGPNIGNTPVIVGSIRQGISHTVLVDDTEVLSTALSGVYACTHSTLGARGSGTSENMQGYYYGGFILPAVPTPKERAVLTKYLASLQGRNL